MSNCTCYTHPLTGKPSVRERQQNCSEHDPALIERYIIWPALYDECGGEA